MEEKEPLKESPEHDFPIQAEPGAGFKFPAMGNLPATYYKAGEDGIIHVPGAARIHAEAVSLHFRQQKDAARRIEARDQAVEQRRNSMGRIEAAIAKSAGGQGELAKEVAATFAALMPAMMKEMRDQVRNEMMAELAAQTAPPAKADKK